MGDEEELKKDKKEKTNAQNLEKIAKKIQNPLLLCTFSFILIP